ncbi:MAG: threonine synthase [Caldithrix sp. RBG_13_44_9]|nr:MAG: threonine synthase [Caldithrix sp. RBG_13_44_9]
MSYLIHLQCSSCGQKFDPDRLWNLCPACDKPLLARYDLGRLQTQLKKEELAGREPTIWRYRELLPVKDQRYQVTLGEGGTPLIPAKILGSRLGIQHLFIKDEGNNPTGSFKARGLAVAVSRAWELGAGQLSIPSAGNAAGALSAYAAAAGLPAFVYMPRDVPQNFIAECKALGASIQLVDGLISDCGRVSNEEAKKYGRFDCSTLKEPYRVEGKKTMGYEMAEQFNWSLPEVIIYPTGGGTGIVGMWKAFEELEQLGWIGQKRPRFVAVQAAGCAPLVKAFLEGKSTADFWNDARTVADGLRVPAAVGDFIILKILYDTRGTALTVTDQEMIEGANLLGKTQGLFVSPESGATVAALQKLKNSGWIKDSEKIVLFNTGSGYKYSHLWY